jgi:CubicO group peptidase (beta-lactamase class C family)
MEARIGVGRGGGFRGGMNVRRTFEISGFWFAWWFLVMLAGGGGTKAQEAPVRPEEAGLSTEGLARVHQLLEEASNQKRIAGAVGLVIRNGKLAYLDAVGMQDVEAAIPMTPASIFRIASMTKPITSAGVMILADAGMLDLSDPLSKYLPEFKFPVVARPRPGPDGKPRPGKSLDDYQIVPAYRPITLRDLLTHTAGFTYRLFDHPVFTPMYAHAGICDGITQCEHTLDENVRRLAGMPLLNQPGTAWQYGLSTDVLGRVIEVVTGKSLAEFLEERLFRPLKMFDTQFVLPESKRARLAALYEPGPDKTIVRSAEGPIVRGALVYSPDLPYRPTPGYFSGGAGLVATAGDYARFLQMLLNRGELDGVQILTPSSVDAMTRDQIGGLNVTMGTGGDGFGYGFGIVRRSREGKGEDSPGTFSWGGIYHTHFWVDPQRELIGIVLTQIYPSDHLEIAQKFHRLVNEAVLD